MFGLLKSMTDNFPLTKSNFNLLFNKELLYISIFLEFNSTKAVLSLKLIKPVKLFI